MQFVSTDAHIKENWRNRVGRYGRIQMCHVEAKPLIDQRTKLRLFRIHRWVGCILITNVLHDRDMLRDEKSIVVQHRDFLLGIELESRMNRRIPEESERTAERIDPQNIFHSWAAYALFTYLLIPIAEHFAGIVINFDELVGNVQVLESHAAAQRRWSIEHGIQFHSWRVRLLCAGLVEECWKINN